MSGEERGERLLEAGRSVGATTPIRFAQTNWRLRHLQIPTPPAPPPTPNLLKVIPSTQTAGLSEPPANEAPHKITATLLEIKGSALAIKTRAGKTVMIDATGAAQAGRSAVLVIGKAFSVQRTYDANGKLFATIIIRAKPSGGSWPRDR